MKTFGWGLLAVTIGLTLTLVAHLFRYEPLPANDNSIAMILVWDRWEARVCMTGMSTSQQLVCTMEDMGRLGKEK